MGVLKNIDIIFDDYLKNEKLINSFCKNHEITPVVLKKYLEQFMGELKSNGEFYKEDVDFRRHFKNWFRKKYVPTTPKKVDLNEIARNMLANTKRSI